MTDVRKIITLSILIFLSVCDSYSQNGGDNTYEFLNLSTSAIVSSLGGMNVSLVSDDPGLAYYNPALLTRESSEMISLNYVSYIAGINYGYVSYSRDIEKYGTFSGGVTYLNYGKFEEADPTGMITGSFRASEIAFNLIWSYNIDSLFRLGANLKPVISHLDQYTSVGALMDIGGIYRSRNGLYSAGATIKNIGVQISSYTGVRERLPFEIVLGASLRLEHAPFRFSLTARHLERYNMVHDYKTGIESNPDQYKGIKGVGENIMRHLIFSAEFIPAENFFISTSLNYQRRRELSLESRASTVGFSLGAGIKLSGMELSFSRSRYHLAGSLTNVSILVKPALYKKGN